MGPDDGGGQVEG